MTNNIIINVDYISFKNLLLNEKTPILVDFWAKWCNSCKILMPILETIAEEFNKILKIIKINIENNNKIAKIYNIRSIPTLGIFKNGKLINTKIGLISQIELKKFINENL